MTEKVILVPAILFAWITENPFYTDVLKCTMSDFIFYLFKKMYNFKKNIRIKDFRIKKNKKLKKKENV